MVGSGAWVPGCVCYHGSVEFSLHVCLRLRPDLGCLRPAHPWPQCWWRVVGWSWEELVPGDSGRHQAHVPWWRQNKARSSALTSLEAEGRSRFESPVVRARGCFKKESAQFNFVQIMGEEGRNLLKVAKLYVEHLA